MNESERKEEEKGFVPLRSLIRSGALASRVQPVRVCSMWLGGGRGMSARTGGG